MVDDQHSVLGFADIHLQHVHHLFHFLKCFNRVLCCLSRSSAVGYLQHSLPAQGLFKEVHFVHSPFVEEVGEEEEEEAEEGVGGEDEADRHQEHIW